MKSKPKIEIAASSFDRLLDLIGYLGVFLLILYPVLNFNQLSDQIPAHFGPDGSPDAYGSKNSIWVLPLIGVLSFLLTFVLSRRPHFLNYLVKITEENAYRQYQNAQTMMRIMNALIAWVFFYLVYAVIQIDRGHAAGLQTNLMLGILILLIVLPAIYLYRSYRLK